MYVQYDHTARVWFPQKNIRRCVEELYLVDQGQCKSHTVYQVGQQTHSHFRLSSYCADILTLSTYKHIDYIDQPLMHQSVHMYFTIYVTLMHCVALNQFLLCSASIEIICGIAKTTLLFLLFCLTLM